MATDLEKAQSWGSEGGRKTLDMLGRKHFVKAANKRWKAWRLANKKKNVKHGTKKK